MNGSPTIPDPIDQAIAAVPQSVPAKRVDFAIQNDNGTTKPVSVMLPADLDWEELVAVLDAVNHIGQQIVQEAQAKKSNPAGLTLVKGPLLPAPGR